MSQSVTDTVTLKVNGKAYKCGGRVPSKVGARSTRKRCNEKNFIRQSPGTVAAGALAAASGITIYTCITCGFTCAGGPETIALLPPRNDWRTPGSTAMTVPRSGAESNVPDLWGQLHREYSFNLDVAASAMNTKCPLFYDGLTPESDGLLRNWYGADLTTRAVVLGQSVFASAEKIRVFDNCPYQPKGAVEDWLAKGLEQAKQGVFSVHLVPMSTSTAWFNDLVVPFAEWHSFKGRIPFEDPLASEPSESAEDTDADVSDADAIDASSDANADADSGASNAERTSPKQDNLLVIYDPHSTVVGHAAVRDARTGKRLWTRPDLLWMLP